MTTANREAPISFRLGRDRERRFKAFRERDGLTMSDALHRLIDAGLDLENVEDPKHPKKKDPKTQERWKV